MQAVQSSAPEIYVGQKHSFTLPSGRKVVSRETNGNDDEQLSETGAALTGMNIYKYISDVCLEDSELESKPTVEDIMEWPANDRAYFVFKCRIINHGPIVNHDQECINPNCWADVDQTERSKASYEEDIEKAFDNDLDGGELRKGIYRVIPYPGGSKAVIEFKTASHKQFRFKILTGTLSKAELDIAPELVNQNTKLYLRELEIYREGQWYKVTTFHHIPSKEMGEIRAQVKKWDSLFDPLVICTCPKCKTPAMVPLFGMPTFYFPVPQI